MSISPYPEINHQKFMSALEPFLTPIELERVETAYVFSKYGHRNQVRDSGERYFEHPRAVAWIIVQELKLYDWQLMILALLHDIREDSYILSWHRIQINFGRTVTLGLKLLTKDPKEGYLERIRSHGTWRDVLVKICDRLNNLRTLGACSEEKIKRQIAETESEFLPLCDHLLTLLPKKDRWRGEYLRKEISTLCEQYKNKIAANA